MLTSNKSKFYLLFLSLFLFSCSINPPERVEHTKLVASDDTSDDIVPASVKKLVSISDKSSIEYQIAAYEAATDLVNQGNNAIAGQDSGRALKLLTLGTHLLPWRKDVAQLRDSALSKFIVTTNTLMSKLPIDCQIIIERVQFINYIAPDGLAKIGDYNKNCPSNVIQARGRLAIEEKDFINFLQRSVPNPTYDKAITDNSDLVNQLEDIVAKNRSFPVEDLLILGFNVFLNLYKNNRIVYDRFEIPKDTVSENDVALKCYRQQEKKEDDDRGLLKQIKDSFVKSFTPEADINTETPLNKARREYCVFAAKSMGVEENVRTTNLNNYRPDEYSFFTEDLEEAVCRSDDRVIYFRTTPVLREKFYRFSTQRHISDWEKHKLVAADFVPQFIILRKVAEYADRIDIVYYIGRPIDSLSIVENVNKNFIKGLKRIYFEIDFFQTYLMYRDVYSGKAGSFELWWKDFKMEKLPNNRW